MEHNKGPWFADMPAGGKDIFIVDAVGSHIGLAYGYKERPAKPNADLMAAAPGLLAACQAVKEEADNWEDFMPSAVLAIIDEEMAAAIAKATGSA